MMVVKSGCRSRCKATQHKQRPAHGFLSQGTCKKLLPNGPSSLHHVVLVLIVDVALEGQREAAGCPWRWLHDTAREGHLELAGFAEGALNCAALARRRHHLWVTRTMC